MVVNLPLKYKNIILLVAGGLFLFSCNKGNDSATPLDINPPRVNTINATADTINIFQDGIRQNNLSAIYPGGATSYLLFTKGTQNFSVKRTNTTNVLLSQSYTIQSAQYYSLFVTGTSAGDIFQTVDAIDTANTHLAEQTSDSVSMIRFVNASRNSGALSLTVGPGNTVDVNNISYAQATPFMLFNALQSQVAKVYVANNATPVITDTLNFQTDVIYTLYAKGSLTGTGSNALSLVLIVNPYVALNP